MACDKVVQDQNFTIGTESTFHLNQLYTSTDGHFSLKINEIHDSRCPEGLICIWGGEVNLKGKWIEYGKEYAFELNSSKNEQQTGPSGFTMKIVDAKPYPKLGAESKSSDLTVTLLIQKK